MTIRDITAMVTLIALLGGCVKAPVQTSSPPLASTGSGTDCERPTDVVLSDQQLKITAAQIGKASVGGLEVTNDTELVKLLSSGDRTALIVDYLLCEAERRGEVDKTDKPRVDYVRVMLSFLYGTRPTPEQFSQWTKDHPPPPRPTARLDTPDFTTENGKVRFAIRSGPREVFRLLDGGLASMNVWVANYPRERLQFAPTPGPFKLDPGHSVEIELGLLCCSVPKAPLTMVIRSDVPSETLVEIQIADPTTLAATFNTLVDRFASSLIKAVPQAVPATQGIPPHSADPAHLFANTAFATVRAMNPKMSEHLAWAISGSMLESLNWPSAAVLSYRQARALPADHELDIPLARALYFAGLKPRRENGETDYATILTAQGAVPSSVLPDPAKLNLSRANVLVLQANHAAAAETLAVLDKNPQFASFATGLRGDLFLGEANPSAAAKTFENCYAETKAPTCGFRKIEANIAANDLPAARSGIMMMSYEIGDAVSSDWAAVALKKRGWNVSD